MAMVEVAFTPLPAHVRTARLVAVAVARRSGVPESLLDEVRLAVGEACSRAVEAHRKYCPAEPVKIELTASGGRFEVVVTDSGRGAALAAGDSPATGGTGRDGAAEAVGQPPGGLPSAQANGQIGLEDGFGLAVIAELADDVRISRTPAGISVCMSWPSSAG
jgi:anti-sigma regulatory factor (Ser/Thr protein kinase)